MRSEENERKTSQLDASRPFFAPNKRRELTRDPRSVMVVVEPSPTGDSGVVVVHDPLKSLDVGVNELLDLGFGSVRVLELELIL